MAETATVDVEAELKVTRVITPGKDTSEFKQLGKNNLMAWVAFGIGFLIFAAGGVMDVLADDPSISPKIIMALGLVIKLGGMFQKLSGTKNWTDNRTRLKNGASVILLLLIPFGTGCASTEHLSLGQQYKRASLSYQSAMIAAASAISAKVLKGEDAKNVFRGGRAAKNLLSEVAQDVIDGKEATGRYKLNKVNSIIGIIIQETMKAQQKETSNGVDGSTSIGREVDGGWWETLRSRESCEGREPQANTRRSGRHRSGEQRRIGFSRTGDEGRWYRSAGRIAA